MSVLDAFLSTWSNARSTFGEGTPQTGARFDCSGKLTELQNIVNSAAPNERWTGTASNAYGNANKEHGRVLGQIAGLDQRLRSEVTASANVVASGRRDLKAVRKWILDAASAAPQHHAGERMMLPIVQKGLKDLTDVVQRSKGDLNAIGGRIQAIGQEYQALGNQKFGGPNSGSTTGDSRKPKIQMVDVRQSPAPEEPPTPEPGGGYGYFTFTGDQPEFVEGAVINLNGPAGPEPVKVTKITDTSFSFISLAGHHERAGRVIEFSVVPAAASPVPGRLNWELRVEASGPLSDLSLVPGASWFNKGVWQVFANNLDSRLPTSPPSSGGVTV